MSAESPASPRRGASRPGSRRPGSRHPEPQRPESARPESPSAGPSYPGPRPLVRVDYTKYDGTPHRGYRARLLGTDEHGTWLGVSRDLVDPATFKYEEPYVLLVPRDAWWTAMFNAPPRRTELYCDITTPARWPRPDQLCLVDLDLDVRRRRGGPEVELLDEDEFAVNSRAMAYPPEVIGNARRAASYLVAAVAGGAEPFAGGYHAWLDQVDP